MFTRNFISWMGNYFLYSSENKFHDIANVSFYERIGTSQYLRYTQCASIGECMKKVATSALETGELSTHNYGNRLMFGTGTTPPTENDYTLESPIYNISYTPGSVLIAPDGEGKYQMYIDHVLTNNTGADITICEVGLFGEVCSKWTSATNYLHRNVMFERTVLDEPLVIPAGKSKLFTYKLTFNQS